MMSQNRVCLSALLLCIAPWQFAPAADRPSINLSPATPAQVLGHHLVRSAQLGPPRTEDGRVRLMPWREQDDVVEGWDWSLPEGIEPIPRSGLIFSRGEKRRFPGNKLADVAVFWREVEHGASNT